MKRSSQIAAIFRQNGQEKEQGETSAKEGSFNSGLLFWLVIFAKKNGTLKDDGVLGDKQEPGLGHIDFWAISETGC